MAARNGVKIGIAMGEREIVGVVLGKNGIPSVRTSFSKGEDRAETASALSQAIGVLKTELDRVAGRATDGAAVHVALLPPHADARMIPFPPMKAAEVEAVVGRDVARYFLGANRPRVVGIRVPRVNGTGKEPPDGPSMSVLAAAAPLDLIESTRAAILGVGWKSVSFASAHGVWVSLARSGKGTPSNGLVAVVGDTAHVLQLEGKDPVAVRRLPSDDLAGICEALEGVSPGSIMVLAGPGAFGGLQAGLSSLGMRVVKDPGAWSDAEEATAASAASGELEIVPPTIAGERRKKARKMAGRLAGAAAVLVIAAMGTQLWGAHRELRAVRDHRASIESEVRPLLSTRDSLNGLTARIQSMDQLSATTPVWTRSLVELAALLPADTYLTGFFASGDTVELEAAGSKAGEAIQALSEAGLFEEIRLQGLVERELEDGETVVERFRLWARLPERGEGGGP